MDDAILGKVAMSGYASPFLSPLPYDEKLFKSLAARLRDAKKKKEKEAAESRVDKIQKQGNNDELVKDLLEQCRFVSRLCETIHTKCHILTREFGVETESNESNKSEDEANGEFAIYLSIGNGKEFDVSFQDVLSGLDPSRVVIDMIYNNAPPGFVAYYDVMRVLPFEVNVAYVPNDEVDDVDLAGLSMSEAEPRR